MALIDMLTDIKSFNYKSVGNKQGEYFGDENATGFTTNRDTKDKSEFVNMKSIFSPKAVDFFNNDNATGYTLNRTQKDLPGGEYISNSGGIYNFKGKTSVDFFGNENAKGFTTGRTQKDLKTGEYIIGSGGIYNFTEKTGFSTFNNNKPYGIDRDSGAESEFEHANGTNYPGGASLYNRIKGVDFFTNRNRPGFLFDMTTTFDASKTSLYIPLSGNPDTNFTGKRGFATFDNTKQFKIDTNPGDRFAGGETPDSELPDGGSSNYSLPANHFRQGLSRTDFFLNNHQIGFVPNMQNAIIGDNNGVAVTQTMFKGFAQGEWDSSLSLYSNISTTNYFSDTHGEGFELNAGDLYPVGQLGEGGRSGFKLEKLFEGKNPEPESQKFTSGYSRVLTARNDVIEIGTVGEDATFGGKYSKTSSPNLPSLSTNDFVDHKYGTPLFPALALQDRLGDVDLQYKKFGGNRGLRAGHPDNPGNANTHSDQPFIIKEVGDNLYSESLNLDNLFRGGVKLLANRTKDDFTRITEFLKSPKGLLFIGKQFLLQFGVEAVGVEGNQFRKAKVYNPLGTLGSLAPTIHLPRHTNPLTLGLDMFVGGPKYQDYEPKSGYGKYKQNTSEDNDGKALWEKAKDKISDTLGIYNIETPVQSSEVTTQRAGFFSNLADSIPGINNTKEVDAGDFGLGLGKIKKGSKVYEVGTSNMLQVPYGGKFGDLRKSAEKLPKDFIKFRIRDAVNGKWIIFPAHMGTITDTVTPEYSKERYIGRPDEVHIYTGTSRAVAFDFKVAAFSKQEIPIIQQKMNALVGLGYPTFKPHIKGEDVQRMVTPYIYLTVGDLFNNTPGYFDNITVTFEENVVWEVQDGLQIPHYFQVSVNFVYIGKTLPNTIGKHYDVPFMKDVGIGRRKFGVFGSNDPKDRKTDRPDYPDSAGILGFGGDKLQNLMKKEAQVP